jgi:Zn-dependent metalloprotease
MKSFRFHPEAIVFGISIALLATTTTIAAAQAASITEANIVAAAIQEEKRLEALAAQAEVKKVNRLDELAATREQLDPLELKELLSLVGFEGKTLKQAWAIAMKESTGRPKSHNGNSNTGDNSYGLFQINMIGGLGEDRRNKFDLKQNSDLWNPVRNAEIAYHMSNGGNDFGAWGIGPNAYNGGTVGSYYKWLDQYPEGK